MKNSILFIYGRYGKNSMVFTDGVEEYDIYSVLDFGDSQAWTEYTSDRLIKDYNCSVLGRN
jgi:hypothetical protein